MAEKKKFELNYFLFGLTIPQVHVVRTTYPYTAVRKAERYVKWKQKHGQRISWVWSVTNGPGKVVYLNR